MDFIYRKKVRFNDSDAAGITFFARVFDYFHIAYEDFMASKDLDLHEQFLKLKTALPVVHAECDYKQTMVLGETINIHVKVKEVRTRTFSIEYLIIGLDGKTKAEGWTKHVYVDVNFQSVSLPEKIAEILRAELN